MESLKPITADDLVPLQDYTATHPLKIDLVYAQEKHPDNLFKCAIYKPAARMLAHVELLPIILKAAQICHEKSRLFFELKDCLRTVEAQTLMQETDIVKSNPQWLQEPGRLLSPPGHGGHPRGMAVDIVLVDGHGVEQDMGTAFDYLTADPDNNPAARSYKNFSADVMARRQLLEDCMMQAAMECCVDLLPLPQEWWDFRLLPAHTKGYAPVKDADLPVSMRMTAL